MNQFESIEAFFEWKIVAEADYKERNPDIEIGGDETVDVGGRE